MGRRFFIRTLDTHNKLTYIIVMKETEKTIDITPTWASIIPPLVEVLKNPKAPAQSKKEVTAELVRLAKIVDDQNKKARVQKEILKELTHDS